MKPVFFALITLLFCTACSSFQPAQRRIQVNLKASPLKADSVEAEFDKYLGIGGLQKQDITVFYYPDDDVACLQFRVNLTTCSLFWGQAHRAAFVEALARYNKDYDQRNLGRSSLRTKRAYGTLRSFFTWETFQHVMQGQSYPKLDIGYYFKDKRPYFALTVQEAANESSTTKSMVEKNQAWIIYFTRAQAEEVATLFDQSNLRGLVSSADTSVDTGKADEYDN